MDITPLIHLDKRTMGELSTHDSTKSGSCRRAAIRGNRRLSAFTSDILSPTNTSRPEDKIAANVLKSVVARGVECPRKYCSKAARFTSYLSRRQVRIPQNQSVVDKEPLKYKWVGKSPRAADTHTTVFEAPPQLEELSLQNDCPHQNINLLLQVKYSSYKRFAQTKQSRTSLQLFLNLNKQFSHGQQCEGRQACSLRLP